MSGKDKLVFRRQEEKDMLKDVSARLGHYVATVQRIEDERDQLQGELESQSARLSSEIEGLEAALEKKERELEIAHGKIASLTSQSKARAAHLKTVEEEMGRYKKAAEELVAVKTQLEEERQEHADTQKELENVTKELATLRRTATEARLAEKKIATQLVTKRSQLDALERAYGRLERTKGDVIDQLIKKKNEEIKAAYQGWEDSTKDKLQAIEARLQQEHEEEIKEKQLCVREVRRELATRTADLEQMTLKYEALEQKVRDLAGRYQANARVWENKVQDAEELKKEYYQAMVEAQARYRGLINSKISSDSELLHMKGVLDGEEARQNKRKRDETHPHNSFMRQAKRALGQRSSNASSIKGISINEINTNQDYVVVANHSGVDLPLKGWRLVNKKGGQEFHFPDDYTLKSQRTVTIWSSKTGGGGSSSKRQKGSPAPQRYHGGEGPDNLVWGAQDVWEDQQKPSACLYDVAGHEVLPRNHHGTAPASAPSTAHHPSAALNPFSFSASATEIAGKVDTFMGPLCPSRIVSGAGETLTSMATSLFSTSLFSPGRKT